jgi:hypothetical protein
MAVRGIDLLQGTLDLLILKSLGTGPNHGYGIAMRIHELSDDVLNQVLRRQTSRRETARLPADVNLLRRLLQGVGRLDLLRG